ncbi:ATP-dependent DNA helicase PIF1-like [Olea europaea var. sylvestris]|uniref:ATP-dependent DNA helicase PIF1-like n=1 Tax=Olea europaea var. sylvestris TaxID=158386 RepID=UPI000C1D42EC|nr:ATP-dependent DNA helicase PIF1-like [Olea europaea var. sylvestris]
MVGEVNCSISKQSALGTLLKMCWLIIWDEAPMVNRCAVESIDKMLRDITDCNLPFDGKVIALEGDFRQILPVPSFIHLALVENMRAKSDPIFCEYLLRIGGGTEQEHTCNYTYADHLYTMVNRVILTPTNECVDYINGLLLEQIPGQSFTYYSFDDAIEKLEQSLQEDFLNTLTPNGIPPHELKLKMNCPVMLLRNINSSEGLCNGTRLTCRKFERNVILVEITTGEYRGKQVFLPRIPFIPLKTDRTTIPFKRTQFSIKPCFAMTINKAQGQTLDFVGLYLPKPVFSHGQLYVALSRAKITRSIKVLLKPTNEIIRTTHILPISFINYWEPELGNTLRLTAYDVFESNGSSMLNMSIFDHILRRITKHHLRRHVQNVRILDYLLHYLDITANSGENGVMRRLSVGWADFLVDK